MKQKFCVNNFDMQKFGLVIQIVLKFLLIFLLFFVWIRFFVKSFINTILISILCTIFVQILFKIISEKVNKSKEMKLKEKEECENMFLSLVTQKNEVDFFFNLASTRHDSIKKRKYIIIKHKTHNVVLYPYIKFCKLTRDDLTTILKNVKKENFKKIVICCGEVEKEVFAFSKNFDTEISILDKFETYSKIYKDYDFFPQITTSYKTDKKTTLKELLAYSFNKSRTKSYLFSAFILFLSSLFIRMNLYYSIITSLLIIFALISYINPFYKSQTKFEL